MEFEFYRPLTILTFTPLVGMIFILMTPRRATGLILLWALFFSAVAFVFSAGMYWDFLHRGPEIQILRGGGQSPYGEFVAWIPAVGINYHLGVDGLSLPLIVLTTLLTFLSVIYSGPVIKDRIKEYYAFFLLLEVGMLGVFVSLDFFLFYIFWEVSLVPMYFLIAIWGHEEDRPQYSAIKFFLYTLFGSLAMLLGILALYFHSGDGTTVQRTFDLVELAARTPLAHAPALVGTLVFWGMFLGFAIKVPVWPFHTWLPDAHTAAPTAGSVILAGILLKMGTYGFVRVMLPILPLQCEQNAIPIAFLAMVSIIYGALVAMSQQDVKRLIAYSSVNHMGYVMLGVSAAMMVATMADKPLGATMALNGAVLQMIAHGIITGALFFLAGMLHERAHTRQIGVFGGLLKQTPGYGGMFVLAGLASLGLPALAGFMAEFNVFVGAFTVGASDLSDPSLRLFLTLTCVSVIGVIITAAYFLWLIQRVFLGPLQEKWAAIYDLRPFEWIALVPLAVLMFWIGLYPGGIVLDVINNMTHTMLRGLGG